MKKLIAAILMVATAVTAQTASAKVIKTHLTNEGKLVLIMTGESTMGDAGALRMWSTMYPIEEVWLAGPGGKAQAGYRLAETIKYLGLDTKVPEGSACFSACFFALIGGDNVTIDGLAGAHAPYLPNPTDDSDEMLRAGEIAGAIMLHHIQNMGYNVTLAYHMLRFTDKDKYLSFMSAKELAKYEAESNKLEDILILKQIDPDWTDRHIMNTRQAARMIGLDNPHDTKVHP